MNYVQRAGRLKQSVFKRLSLIIATYKCLAEILTREVRARIVGRQGQMITFDFYFTLSLGKHFTTSLLKSLQSESLSTASGHN